MDNIAFDTTESLDIRLLDSAGNNFLNRVETLPANQSADIILGNLEVPAVDAAPNCYRLEVSVQGQANSTRVYPILVDRVSAQEADLRVSAFLAENNEGATIANVVANTPVNRTLGQHWDLSHFTTPQTAPATVNLGVVPNFNEDGNMAQLIFYVRNEGRQSVLKDTAYDGFAYWATRATPNDRTAALGSLSALRAYDRRNSAFANVTSPMAAENVAINTSQLFSGRTGWQIVNVTPVDTAQTWSPRLETGWGVVTYRWFGANLLAAMNFDQRTDVANVRVRNVRLTNNNEMFNRAVNFPSMDVTVDMAQAQGVTGHISQPTVTGKAICPVAFEIPVPNPARDKEVYVYPMQVTLRVRAADVDRVWGTTSNKWRTIQNLYGNLSSAGGLKAFLDAIGPQKIVGGRTYALADVAPAAELPKYIQVRQVGNDYHISFMMVIADMAKPTGLDDVVAVNNMFIVYDGQKNNVLVDPIYAGEPTAPITPPIPSGPITPPISAPVSPTSGGSSSGGGCSAFGFAPLALLLLAPLALLRKRG